MQFGATSNQMATTDLIFKLAVYCCQDFICNLFPTVDFRQHNNILQLSIFIDGKHITPTQFHNNGLLDMVDCFDVITPCAPVVYSTTS